MPERKHLTSAKRIVIKIGTRVVTGSGPGLDDAFLDNLARQVAQLHQRGCQVTLVTSGAVHLGRRTLNLSGKREDIELRQAAAAVGQPELMRHYMDAFAAHGLIAAQLLLTRDDVDDRKRYLHVRNTLNILLKRGVVPVINENDSVSVEGVTFIENDLLGALIALKTNADALIFLSDSAGLFTCNPKNNPDKARLIFKVQPNDDVSRFADGTGGPESRGGMEKKCEAARLAANAGIYAVMVDGNEPDVILRVLNGESLGTVFVGGRRIMPARERWIATAARPNGVLVVDEGARKALLSPGGSSLLPAGIVEVSGDFNAGDVVKVMSIEGTEIARGLVNYSHTEVEMLMGQNSNSISKIIGHVGHAEVIHRDNMVISNQ